MDPATIGAIISGVSTIADLFSSGSSDAANQYSAELHEVALEEKELAGKYGSYADMFIDPSSYWQKSILKSMQDATKDKSKEQISRLRGQGIYSPAMEALIEKDMFVEVGESYYDNVSKMLGVAQKYSAQEQASMGSYADTMASAYGVEFAGNVTQPGYGEQLTDMMTGLEGTMTTVESIASMFE